MGLVAAVEVLLPPLLHLLVVEVEAAVVVRQNPQLLVEVVAVEVLPHCNPLPAVAAASSYFLLNQDSLRLA